VISSRLARGAAHPLHVSTHAGIPEVDMAGHFAGFRCSMTLW
jgi:hypothetical protein